MLRRMSRGCEWRKGDFCVVFSGEEGRNDEEDVK